MSGKREHLIQRRQFLKTTGVSAAALGLGTGTVGAMPNAELDTSGETIDLKAMVFTHFEAGGKTGDFPGEFQKWYDYYGLTNQVEVPGALWDVFYNEDGVAATVTGMGHSLCAPSVASILASPRFDFENTYFLSAGISGTPPDVGTLGSVFVGDYVVNWDYAHRWAQEDSEDASFNREERRGDNRGKSQVQDRSRGVDNGKGKDGDDFALMLLPFRPFDYVYRLNPDLVQKAADLGSGVQLIDSDEAKAYRQNYPEKTARREPFIDVGTTVSGEEYWHGQTFSEQAQYICDQYEASTYATTEMEDYATATAIDRHDYLDRYLSLRSVSNFDQPYPGQTVKESLQADSGGYIPSIENVFRVGSTVVDDIVERWGMWKDGVPK